jgi:hypothetical protein
MKIGKLEDEVAVSEEDSRTSDGSVGKKKLQTGFALWKMDEENRAGVERWESGMVEKSTLLEVPSGCCGRAHVILHIQQIKIQLQIAFRLLYSSRRGREIPRGRNVLGSD